MAKKIREIEELSARYPHLSPILLFKISMTKYGAVFTDRALTRLQEPDFRFTKAEPFGIPLEIRKEDFYTPGPVSFRDGSSVLVNFGEPYDDPYVIDWDAEEDVFLAMDGEEIADTVSFIPRPAFFDQTTSKGTPMDRVGGTCSAQRLLLNALQRCRFWEEGSQCHYCALFGAGSVIGEVDPGDIRETLLAALAEPGRFSEISLSGGSDFGGDPPFSNELERYIRTLQIIGEPFDGKADIQLMAPAYPKRWLARLYEETPLSSYRPNIEIWDAEIWKKLCPGKEKWVGREEWVKRMCEAVEIFGRGRVYTQMVCGAELAQPGGMTDPERAVQSALEGSEFFSKNGISCHVEMWRPNRGEKLGWQATPDMDYYVRLSDGFHRFRREYGICDVDNNFMRGGDNPDADLERGDFSSVLPDLRQKNFRKTRDDYRAERIPAEVCGAVARDADLFLYAGPGIRKDPDLDPADPAAEAARGDFSSETGLLGGPDSDSIPSVFRLRGARIPDGKRLVLPVISERSELSAFLTRHLWANRPISLWISAEKSTGTGTPGFLLQCRVYRNHLVGPVFSERLAARNPAGSAEKKDIAHACELHVLSSRPCVLPVFALRDAEDRFCQKHLS